MFFQRCNARHITYFDSLNGSFLPKCIEEIDKIISLDDAPNLFVLDDPNLTKSWKMSNLKRNATKCIELEMQNLTKNVFDQKSSELCVPISLTTLLRYAIKTDLGFKEIDVSHTFERILSSLIMIVYPRSMAGLNLNPTEREEDFQITEIEILLKRLCQKTYLMDTGWEIIRHLGGPNNDKPVKSICSFNSGKKMKKKIFLNKIL